MIDTYPELGPFGELYEQWVCAEPRKQDATLEAQLRAAYRDAWANDIGLDRVYVLYFIYDRKDPETADLVIEGLRSTDFRVAREAATIVSVTHGGGFDLGPDVRNAYRELVRRFPENDTIRPRALHGHEENDFDDAEERPFVNLYEEWMSIAYPRDAIITRRLVNSYREAWASGDSIDRAFVLHFLLTNKNPSDPGDIVDGRDLVVDGLATEDPRLARTAAFAAWCLIDDGVDLGPDIRSILEAHRVRFPEVGGSAWLALRALDERGESQA